MINQFLWQQILEEAERQGIPLNKKRAILREFLQVKFLTSLYSFSGCQKLAFIGGAVLKPLKINSESDFFANLKRIYQEEKNQMSFYKRQIRPFLLQEEKVKYLDFLASL